MVPCSSAKISLVDSLRYRFHAIDQLEHLVVGALYLEQVNVPSAYLSESSMQMAVPASYMTENG
jgi:hypothetical protein